MADAPHTFLFADLVGYTALADAEGDDHAAAVAAALQTHIHRLAPQYDGEVVKAMGDAAMLHCGDAGAAIRLGLGLASEVESDAALPPVRIGIHSGSAVSREGDWYGRAVNVAARLCAVAAGGEVLVSEATLAAARDLPKIEVGERRLHWLKNVTEPVAAHAAELKQRSWLLSAKLRMRACPRHPTQAGTQAISGGLGG
jgi:class 3 adenylate cyclase